MNTQIKKKLNDLIRYITMHENDSDIQKNMGELKKKILHFHN